MKVIITGGAGFIGGHAVRHFVGCGDTVLNIDKLTYASKTDELEISEFLQFDICDTDRLISEINKFNPDFFIHFAAETHVDNSIKGCSEFVHSNVRGVASVLDACRDTKTKLCHISTDEVYGPATNKAFFEEDALNPKNPYAATKAAGDMLLKSYENTFGMQSLIVRPSNNYGPRQHSEKFIPKLLQCLIEGKKFPLYGSGDQEREWTYVEDTVKVIRNLLISNNLIWNSVYNLSSNISSTNLETAKKIIEIYNRINGTSILLEDAVACSVDRLGNDKKYWISSNKLNSIVDLAYTEFQLGLEKTVISYVK